MSPLRALADKKAVHLRALQTLFGTRPVPLAYWSVVHRAAKRLLTQEDPLFSEPPPIAGAELRHPGLRELLQHDQLGAWSLDPRTIELLWAQLHRHRPRTIIECGAGASTLVLGKYIETVGIADGMSVSIEQNASYKETIEARVLASGMRRTCRIVHAPLSGDDSYQLDQAALAAELGSREADLILIDGPSGRPGCRVWTLPLLAPFCRRGTRWFLDDAFRDGEMRILRAWSRIAGVSVEGIYPVAKGLATGLIGDPTQVTFEAVARSAGFPRPVSDEGWGIRQTA